MKRLVFSEKENRYVELEFTLSEDNQKIYNTSIQGYDKNGNSIKVVSEDELEQKNITILNDKISKSTYASDRLAICKTCENYSYKFCTKCSCFLPIKVLIKGTSCPIKKWNAING
jgi:S-adenosylmethionine hydrolase